jgi:hypothetical protein
LGNSSGQNVPVTYSTKRYDRPDGYALLRR